MKYLLNKEKENMNLLVDKLSESLKLDSNKLQKIQEEFFNIIKMAKDGDVEDIINIFLESLIKKMRPLLDEKITPGMQVGIGNEYFSLVSYGGRYNGKDNSKFISEETMFSLDSISKLATACATVIGMRDENYNMDSIVSSYNDKFKLNSSIEDILKFRAMIITDKRIDGLDKEDTIRILKDVKEDLIKKGQYKNYYQYNDIGYMILRLSIDNFLEKMDIVLNSVKNKGITYNNSLDKDNITGGRIGEEYITPDIKGRDILYPGHTGLYANISGLLELFYKIIVSEDIINNKEKEMLFSQPYKDPVVYDIEGKQKVGANGSLQYMAKVAGIYRRPLGIKNPSYDKLASCDMSNLTTDKSVCSTGTCGSWVMLDNLSYDKKFGPYVGGFLTNPYSFVENKDYPDKVNYIPNTGIRVNNKAVVLGYQRILNEYKEIIADYGLILELITEYIKICDRRVLDNDKTVKRLIKKMDK